MIDYDDIEAETQSLLSWERGLKYMKSTSARQRRVAPLVGAWIEITMLMQCMYMAIVAPLVGAWIEILIYLKQ